MSLTKRDSEAVTQFMGATLACVASSSSFAEFKTCIIPEEGEAPLTLDSIEQAVGNFINGVKPTAHASGTTAGFRKQR